MKTKFLSLLSLILALLLLVSCGTTPSDKELPPDAARINGTLLEEFTIVYSNKGGDYSARAAEYIQEEIKNRTSLELEVKTDTAEKTWEYEIIVGETGREISKNLDPETKGMQFAIISNDKQVALEGDHFVIAAAAYYFINTYITDVTFNATIPTTATVCEPITEKANNYIFLIGDGMGLYQTKLFEVMSLPTSNNFSDNEDIFYGYMFPYQGFAKTYSQNSDVTDSAAGGTALASGYKTNNENIGMFVGRKDVQSLTELAGSLGMSTAVMSTDVATGATPASFSAHAKRRDLTDIIEKSQKETVEKYGTIIKCGYGSEYAPAKVKALENDVLATIDTLDDNEKGFFMMYEEAHIDKHSHSNEIDSTFFALMRFNQIIGVIMEYAFYNPDTFVIMTADHETGNLLPDSTGKFVYSQTSHSGADVPVFAYGHDADVFNGKTINNIQIPKTIASFWGVNNFGNKDLEGPLTK